MPSLRQFSLQYLMLEVFWIAVLIGLLRSIYLTWTLVLPRPWLFTIPAAFEAGSIAVFGLFGRMRVGMFVGLPLAGLAFLLALFGSESGDSDGLFLIIAFDLMAAGSLFLYTRTTETEPMRAAWLRQATHILLAVGAFTTVLWLFFPSIH